MVTTPAPAQKTPTSRRWASLADAADYLGVSVTTLRRMVSAGHVHLYRFGRNRFARIDLNELDALATRVPTVDRDEL